MQTDNLFFDGRCSLCSKEIKLLTRLKKPSLELTDIHSLKINSSGHFTKEELLKVLHLKTAEGEWLTGLDATLAAWSHTSWGWVFKPLGWPIFKSMANYIYTRWANKRYCKLYQ